MMEKIALTGIKPTGTPHIGNYLGMIKPALELADPFRSFYFIADYHALTTIKDADTLKTLTYQVAATWLALGLDPEQVVFYRQSDIPEIFELAWILSCVTPKGTLNRAHAYKAATEANTAAGKTPDADISAGLFIYPVLMAADILLFGAHIVPVGHDQKQHVEIARDVAGAFNKSFGNLLVLPEPRIQAEVETIPGIDGRKMSKNYANTIPIFGDPAKIRRKIMRIVTDSKRPEEPKDPNACNLFQIYRHFAPPQALERTRQTYIRGGLAYSDLKAELFDLLQIKFESAAEAYQALIEDTPRLDRIFEMGAKKARSLAVPTMQKIRGRIGVV
jgi:tryptophanyl-tRNA synthetase